MNNERRKSAITLNMKKCSVSGLAGQEPELVTGLTGQQPEHVSGLTASELTGQEPEFEPGLTGQVPEQVSGLTGQKPETLPEHVSGLTGQEPEFVTVSGLNGKEPEFVSGLTRQKQEFVPGLKTTVTTKKAKTKVMKRWKEIVRIVDGKFELMEVIDRGLQTSSRKRKLTGQDVDGQKGQELGPRLTGQGGIFPTGQEVGYLTREELGPRLTGHEQELVSGLTRHEPEFVTTGATHLQIDRKKLVTRKYENCYETGNLTTDDRKITTTGRKTLTENQWKKNLPENLLRVGRRKTLPGRFVELDRKENLVQGKLKKLMKEDLEGNRKKFSPGKIQKFGQTSEVSLLGLSPQSKKIGNRNLKKVERIPPVVSESFGKIRNLFEVASPPETWGIFNPVTCTNLSTRRNLAAVRDQLNPERSEDVPGLVIGQNLDRREVSANQEKD